MSVEQRIKISCDVFDCDASISSGVDLTAARIMTNKAGWVNTVHYIGVERRVVLQDFCPEHRGTAFDWQTWREKERQRASADPAEGDEGATELNDRAR